MSTLYRCPECKLTLTRFEVVEEIEHVPSEFWGARSTRQSVYLVCGHCGSDVEEAPPESKEEDSNE